MRISFFRVTKNYASDSDDSENENELDIEKLPPLEIGPGEHKLQYNYCLWYHRGSMTKFKSPSVSIKSMHMVMFFISAALTFFSVYLRFVIFIWKFIYFSEMLASRMQDYSRSLHFVGRCASVEQFWSVFCHLVRPSQLKPFRELHLFKSGIKPMWEDPCNSKGGKWMIRLRKNKIDQAWENVCMAMLGEQFLVGPEICGIVLSTRFPVSI